MDARYPFIKRRNNDDAISPVVGTILMVGVTVALAATVLTVMNAFGNSTPTQSSDVVFKVQAIDQSGNSATDRIKLTYIAGPLGIPDGDVLIQVKDDTGTSATTPPAPTTPPLWTWTPGDFRLYDNPGTGASTWFVTVSHLGSTVVDTTVRLDE